jgi:GT2 family glycosyltransferase
LLKEINKPEMNNVAVMSSVSNNPMAHEDILKRNQAEDEPARIIDISFLPLYCACVNVRAFASIGGVPEFPYAWFEDEAVCAKLKKHGYNLAVCPSSYVYHQGMGTIKGLVNSQKDVLDVMKNNFNMLKNFVKDNT